MACRLIPSEPYLVLGQYGGFDSTRAPAGKETAWAYTHVPQEIRGDAAHELTGSWDERETEIFAERIEQQVEVLAPGFRNLIRGRHVFTPTTLRAGQPQPGQRRVERRYGTAPSAARVPARSRAGAARDADRGSLSGLGVKPSGRRGARRTGGQRRLGRARGGPLAAPGAAALTPEPRLCALTSRTRRRRPAESRSRSRGPVFPRSDPPPSPPRSSTCAVALLWPCAAGRA